MAATTILNNDENSIAPVRLRVALRINGTDDFLLQQAKEIDSIGNDKKEQLQFPFTVSRTESGGEYKIEFTQKESWSCSTETKLPLRCFYFPFIFTPKDNNKLYNELILPLKQQIIDGYSVTVIGFGATRTGKTHTLIGHPIQTTSSFEEPTDNLAILPRLFTDLSSILEQLKSHSFRSSVHMENSDGNQPKSKLNCNPNELDHPITIEGHDYTYSIKMSMYDILYERIFDLLHPDADSLLMAEATTNETEIWTIKEKKTAEENPKYIAEIPEDSNTVYIRNITELVRLD
jgi:hypothetical protein